MSWYLDILKTKYAQFSGRAGRKEFWMFCLFHLLVILGLSMVDAITGTNEETGLGLLTGLYLLATLVPAIALMLRRLHDTDRSGLWLLLIPTGIGGVVLLVFMCLDGTPGDNQFGSSPKTDAAEAHLAGA
jgi:uncharacterized membrane protein YhaH (DUF805 family)